MPVDFDSRRVLSRPFRAPGCACLQPRPLAWAIVGPARWAWRLGAADNGAMKTRRRYSRLIVVFVLAVLLPALSLWIGVATRPTNDLAFLERWKPIHESTVGDMDHPDDPAYGTWEVLRFREPYGYFPARPGSGPAGRFPGGSLTPAESSWWQSVPDVEALLKSRLPAQFRQGSGPVDGSWVDRILDPGGGPDRLLWCAGGMTMGPDRFQIWTMQESWFERVWGVLKRRLGITK